LFKEKVLLSLGERKKDEFIIIFQQRKGPDKKGEREGQRVQVRGVRVGKNG